MQFREKIYSENDIYFKSNLKSNDNSFENELEYLRVYSKSIISK
jgi:hypothetical protein